MTYDHRATTIHRADLDREIDTIRNERLLSADGADQTGPAARLRRAAGRLLIATGTALIGRDGATTLRAHRA
jgi:hypothetical protein